MAAPATDDSNPFSGFFWGNSPNVNQQLRQRIALQMMGQGKSKGFPKNIGEGLTAIGDSLGDIGMARMLERGDLAQQGAAQRDAASLMGGDQPAAYAPPDRAVTPPVAADTSAAVPQQPGSPLSADEAKAGVSSGDYNVLDAQANLGFKPTPGYMQDAIAAKEKDPEMQAYYGQLSAKEAKNAQDVSPTGAAGPFQITRSTGKGLGLTPGQRFDPAASTAAVQQLTAQNAAVFEKVNGRPPTFQELALMHQQGGRTGANMVAGTGNASPGNLAVNNIPRGASPQQAVAGINRYYGMPNAPAPVGARDAIASQLVQQPPPQGPPAAPPGPVGGPLPNPTLAGASAPLPATLTPPPSPLPPGPGGPPPDQRLAGIQALPPAPSGLRAMPPPPAPPPQQLAQNGATPGYVMPEPQAPQAPPFVPLSPLGQRALAILNANPNNEYYAKGAIGQTLNNEIAKQKQQQDQANEAFKKDYDSQVAMRMERQKQLADQAKRIADYQKTQGEIQQGRVPVTRKLNGQDVQWDEASGQWLPPPRGAVDPNAPPTAELTEPQQKAMLYYTGGRLAHEALQGKEQIIAQGLKEEALGHVPFGSNALLSSQYRQAKTASDQFVQYFIHSLSGAAFSKAEQEQKIKNMMPSYGDDPGTLALKAQQRESFIRSEYAALGPGGQQAADWNIKQHKDNAATKQSTINQEMAGVTPKGIGDVKTNKKTGAKRLWTGQNWVEM